MKLNLVLVGVGAVLLASGCARDPGVTPEPPSVAQQADAAKEDTSASDTPATPCEDALDQSSMTACWSQASQSEEERVEATLKHLDELFASKRAAARPRLQDDQRRWREFVNGHCGLYGELFEGGSAASMTVSVCRWQLAQARLEQLGAMTDELDR